MTRYWVNVRGADELPHDGVCRSVDGSLADAKMYVNDVMIRSNRRNHVIIMEEMKDYSLEIVEEYEV